MWQPCIIYVCMYAWIISNRLGCMTTGKNLDSICCNASVTDGGGLGFRGLGFWGSEI